MLHAVKRSCGDQYASGARVQRRGIPLGLLVEIEFLQTFFFAGGALLVVIRIDALRDGEDDEQGDRKTNAELSRVLFGKKIGHRSDDEDKRRDAKADGNFGLTDVEVPGELVFLVVPLVTQGHDADG